MNIKLRFVIFDSMTLRGFCDRLISLLFRLKIAQKDGLSGLLKNNVGIQHSSIFRYGYVFRDTLKILMLAE
jgi:hypothetical protein